jgi:hypothetical protein
MVQYTKILLYILALIYNKWLMTDTKLKIRMGFTFLCLLSLIGAEISAGLNNRKEFL